MGINWHYDRAADVAWLRFDGYDASTVVAEEIDTGLRELDPATGEMVGLEFWRASDELHADFLRMLPPPQFGIAT